MKNNHYIRRSLTALTVFCTTLAMSCGGGGNSPAGPAPNVGNIPALAKRPANQNQQQKKLIQLNGNVFNALTKKPIERATIWVHVLEVAAAPAPKKPAAKPGTKPGKPGAKPPTTPSSTPTQLRPPPSKAGNSSPAPTASPGSASIDPLIFPSDANPSPGASVLPDSIPEPDGSAPTPDTNPPPDDALPDSTVPDGAPPDSSIPDESTPDGPPTGDAPSKDAPPPPPAGKDQSFRTTTNNQGKFWLDDIPQGVHALTVVAPDYRTLTVVKVNPSSLDIPLMPLKTKAFATDVAGMVLTSSEKPVDNATVSPSFGRGESPGIPAFTNSIGEFVTPEVPWGRRSFAALVLEPDYTIRLMGVQQGFSITEKSVKSTKAILNKPLQNVNDKPLREELEKKVEDMLEEGNPEASPSTIFNPIEPVELTPIETPVPYDDENPIDEDSIPIEERIPGPTPMPPASIPDDDGPTELPSEVREILEETPSSQSTRGILAEEEQEQVKKPANDAKNKKDKENFNLFQTIGKLLTGEDGEGVPERSVFPVVTVRSVINDTVLSGEVTPPEDYTLQNVSVFLTLKSEQKQPLDEVFLYTKNFHIPLPSDSPDTIDFSEDEDVVKPDGGADKKPKQKKPKRPAVTSKGKQNVSFRLPRLTKGQSYHLQFTASNSDRSSILYKHIYNLNDDSESLNVKFALSPPQLTIDGEEENIIPHKPRIKWDPVTGSEIYRVLLETGENEDARIIWEAWTPDTEITYPLTTIPGRLRENQVYRVSVSAIKGLHKFKDKDRAYIHNGYRAFWADLVQTFHKPFEVVKLRDSEE